jgi:hypothetical protein
MESQASGNGFEVVGDECLRLETEELIERLGLGRQTLHGVADELFQVGFTLQVKIRAHSRKAMSPFLRHIQDGLFDLAQQTTHRRRL